jgi:hypothetical protein
MPVYLLNRNMEISAQKSRSLSGFCSPIVRLSFAYASPPAEGKANESRTIGFSDVMLSINVPYNAMMFDVPRSR